MTSAKFIPAVPAVTQVVTPAVPAKVVVELTLHEAAVIRGLLGQCSGCGTWDLFSKLTAMARAGHFPDVTPSNSAQIPSIKFAPF